MSTATSVGLGVRALPVTGAFLLPFAVINAALSAGVVSARLATKTYHGDRKASAIGTSDLSTDEVHLAVRAQQNFLENAPLALLFASIVELNGGDRKTLTYMLALFTAARVMHPLGFSGGLLPLRAAGYYSSMGVITGMGAWAAYLSKGYWGF